jgi:hypothetical protein
MSRALLFLSAAFRPVVRASIPILLWAALPALLQPAVASADMQAHVRDGWFLGVGLGGGSAAITANGNTSDREGGGAGSFRVGYAINPKIGLGVESNTWLKSQDNVDLSFTTYAATLFYFPSEGLILRGGIGGGDATAEIQNGNTTVSATESGFGITAGVAYEFRLGRNFALGPQLDYSFVNLDSFDANYVNGGLSFNWYFIPK